MTRYAFSLHPLLRGALSLVLALGLVACDNEIQNETTNDVPETANGAPEHIDLFACGVQLSCPAYCIHLGYGDCGGPQTLACPGGLWLQGVSGALEVHERPGPGNWMGDRLTLLLGDGRALVQERTRICEDATGCDLENIPWEFGAHELCDVKAVPDTCQPDNCNEFPRLENCVPLETDWTCGEVAMAMAPIP